MDGKTFYLGHELNPKEYQEYPLPWDRIFSSAGPLAVEIGFGNGEFLMNWARQQPDWNFVGVELSLASMERILKRIHQSGIRNVKPIHEDARFAIREFFPDNSIRHVMMNFPDPWFKERHKHRRLLNESFIRTLAAVLENNGVYELVTDQQWYAQESRELFIESGYFDVKPLEEDPSRPVVTKYEQKWREMGRHTYRLLCYKIKPITVNRLLEDNTMPHVFVDRDIQRSMIENLVGFQVQEGMNLAIVKEAFHSLEEDKFLLRVIAKDVDYQQTFMVSVKKDEEHRWLVKLDPVVQPYRTPAVKMAVWEIGKHLQQAS